MSSDPVLLHHPCPYDVGGQTDELTLSIVMPCLNERDTIESCIDSAQELLDRCGVKGEIIIVDNGSTDGSDKHAQSKNASVLYETRQGYGAACRSGISAAHGTFIILGDSDGTYDFRDAFAFVEMLRDGCDIVIGSRLQGHIVCGAMPWLHRHIGIPFLTWLLNHVSGSTISDAHCGLRAFKQAALCNLRLEAEGMEFASEMIVEAVRAGLRVTELPVNYYPRRGQSKLRTMSDGWRHLRLLVTYSFVAPAPRVDKQQH
jgi:glycosyltransferase involved in cell wall biosynthesis